MVATHDGRRAYIGCNDGSIRVWDLEKGEEIGQLKDHKGCVFSLALSPDDRYLASGGKDRIVRVWDLKTGDTLRRWEGHVDDVECVAFAPTGGHVASASSDGTIRIWAPTGNNPPVTMRYPERRHPITLAYSTEGDRLVSGGDETILRVWDPATGKPQNTFSGHQPVQLEDGKTGGETSAVLFLPGGSTVASFAYDETIRLWDARNGRQSKRLDARAGWRMIASEDGKLLASGHKDGVVRVWLLP